MASGVHLERTVQAASAAAPGQQLEIKNRSQVFDTNDRRSFPMVMAYLDCRMH